MKKNPYDLIKEAGLKPDELGEQGLKVLSIYDDAAAMLEKRPNDTSVKETTSKTFAKVESAIKKIIKAVQEKKKTEADKEAETKLKKENSSLTMKEINAGLEELSECDAELKRLKKAKKEKSGTKPKTKTRYTKLKEKLLSVTTLIPDNLKNDIDTLKKTEGILLVAHRELIKAWGMNKVTGKAGEKAIEDKFDELEDKAMSDDPDFHLKETVAKLKEAGIKVKKFSSMNDVEDAAIEITNKLHVQVHDHSPRKPTFSVVEETEDGAFQYSDEITTVAGLAKSIKSKQ